MVGSQVSGAVSMSSNSVSVLCDDKICFIWPFFNCMRFTRYDPNASIPTDTDSEQDRVIFIKSVAQFMVRLTTNNCVFKPGSLNLDYMHFIIRINILQ